MKSDIYTYSEFPSTSEENKESTFKTKRVDNNQAVFISIAEVLEFDSKSQKLPAIIKEIDSLHNLEEGWDYYGAAKIRSSAISVAKTYAQINNSYNFNPDFIGPTRSGGVVIEYSYKGYKLVYTFYSSDNVTVTIFKGRQYLKKIKVSGKYYPTPSFIV